MRVLNIVAATAVVLSLGFSTAGDETQPPNCTGVLEGEKLTTTIEFADGSSVDAPWRVVQVRQVSQQRGAAARVLAVHLDRVVEKDPTGNRTTTPFPSPIETTFQGQDDDEVVFNAAQVWCITVLKVKTDEVPSTGAKRRPLPFVKAAMSLGMSRILA